MSKSKTTKKAKKATKSKGKATRKKAADRPKPKPRSDKTTAKAGDKRPKRVSALDAAAQVLAKAGKPMRAQELITAMTEKGLWTSPAGKTPHATLYSAILREINSKGKAARFRKVERGQFKYRAPKGD